MSGSATSEAAVIVIDTVAEASKYRPLPFMVSGRKFSNGQRCSQSCNSKEAAERVRKQFDKTCFDVVINTNASLLDDEGNSKVKGSKEGHTKVRFSPAHYKRGHGSSKGRAARRLMKGKR